MPILIQSVPADLYFEYKEVKIYNTYKNNEIDNIIRTFSFVLNAYDQEDESFDIRDLKGWRDWSTNSNVSEEDHIKSFLKACIDNNVNFDEVY